MRMREATGGGAGRLHHGRRPINHNACRAGGRQAGGIKCSHADIAQRGLRRSPLPSRSEHGQGSQSAPHRRKQRIARCPCRCPQTTRSHQSSVIDHRTRGCPRSKPKKESPADHQWAGGSEPAAGLKGE
eukprot:325751-Prymnesium_polylepis.2